MKNWSALLACLLLSFVSWLVLNLSRVNYDIVSVPVVAESNIEGRAARSAEAVTVTARCRASGFRLVRLSTRRKDLTVRFDASDFTHREGDFFSISAAQLQRYAADLFGPGVHVESFFSEQFQFRFAEENCRRVAVRGLTSISFRPQYTALSEMVFSPDSVTVYGAPDVLRRLEMVPTALIDVRDVRGDIHGEVALEAPYGLRLSQQTVSYSCLVSRYVELRQTLPVVATGVPSGTELVVYPATVEAVLRCVFPLVEDPAGKIACHVDYAEFARSRSGRCALRAGALPQGVIDCRFEPEVCSCVEKLARP
ncbi:MAG: YbbR-like domain-containing protein [Bacteroidales bacterium]|nr:YbbR-like domain-containing protein [Bacteroidales bacterium]